MDRELAIAVLQRWDEGDAVYAGTLYKAASVLGIDPSSAVLEARFYTFLDDYLAGGGPMEPPTRELFSAAAGYDVDSLEKTASAYNLDTDRLIVESLRRRNFVPDLDKFAEAMAGMDMPMQPQPGEMLQQQPQVRAPEVRVQPGPTAPMQLAPSSQGNANQLAQQAAQQPQDGMAGQAPQQDAGMQQQQPGAQQAGQPMDKDTVNATFTAMNPEEKVQNAVQYLHPDVIPRYAQKLQEIEQAAGIPMTDPSQVKKLVKQLEKQDGTVLDQAIDQIAPKTNNQQGGGNKQQGSSNKPASQKQEAGNGNRPQ